MSLFRACATACVLLSVSFSVFAGGSQETQSPAPKPVRIEHKLGAVDVPHNPKTVVSFSHDAIDTLDLLGIKIAGLPKANLPGYLSKFKDSAYADLGTLFEPNFEKIYSLKPDVIFIGVRVKVFGITDSLLSTGFRQAQRPSTSRAVSV